MKQKSKPKTPTLKPYIYRGIFRCAECGCFITTETQKGHNYLHCTKRVKRDCSQPFVREESIQDQVAAAVGLMALPPEWADWMIGELEAEQTQDTKSYEQSVQAINDDMQSLDTKLDRLLTAYVEGDIAADEYRKAKGRLVHEKQQLTDRLTATQDNRAKRFEPAIRFIKEAKQAGILASGTNPIASRDFLRKNGSNLTLENRKLKWQPRDAWQLIVDYGSFAQPTNARSHDRALVSGETRQISMMRRRRDSNSRDPCGPTGFQDRRIRPLCHSSGLYDRVYLSRATRSKGRVCPRGEITRVTPHPLRSVPFEPAVPLQASSAVSRWRAGGLFARFRRRVLRSTRARVRPIRVRAPRAASLPAWMQSAASWREWRVFPFPGAPAALWGGIFF